MIRAKALISLFLAVSVLILQVGGVFAAPSPQTSSAVHGLVHSITLEMDSNTAITTVMVEVRRGQETQTVRISQETALKLGLVGLDDDGKPVINELSLGKHIEIESSTILPDPEEKRHPVGEALATFFFEGVGTEEDEVYASIMEAHSAGVGFGVIAQALWLTTEIPGGSLVDFQTLLAAKQENDYSGILEDGSTPQNWTELRAAILEGKRVKKLGDIVSNQADNPNGNNQVNNNSRRDTGKDKKGNHGKGNESGPKK